MISAAALFDPKPSPRQTPAPMAITFFSAAANLDANHIQAGIKAQRPGCQSALHLFRQRRSLSCNDHRGRFAGRYFARERGT